MDISQKNIEKKMEIDINMEIENEIKKMREMSDNDSSSNKSELDINDINDMNDISEEESCGSMNSEVKEEINKIFLKNVKTMKNKKNNKKSYIITKNISLKQELLLTSLVNFYLNKNNLDIIVPIIKQQTILSLRLLDWLVTNYSKKHNICYPLSINNNKDTYMPSNKNFNLWMDYKNQLKAFSKRTFDPFCRRERIVLKLDTLDVIFGDYEKYTNDEKYMVTTVGQLNFFRWAILNKVLDYAYKNKHHIDIDMLEASDKRNKSPSFKRQLSKNNHSAKSHELKILIEF